MLPLNGGQKSRVELATWQQQPSLLADSFRAAMTSILFSTRSGTHANMVLVTSPGPVEGKTTVISNLAIATAEVELKVVLIDADLRKPRLHAAFDVSNTWGLSDLLRSQEKLSSIPLEGLAVPTAIPRLSLIPSGPAVVSPTNLLYSPRLAELISRLKREFDMVLVDSPPLLQLVDARLLGRLSDGVVLVVRAGQTPRIHCAAAHERLREDGIPLLGVILNDWNPKAPGHYYYGHYAHSSTAVN
jgi:capsular exopolysaccharide synthesis family protein